LDDGAAVTFQTYMTRLVQPTSEKNDVGAALRPVGVRARLRRPRGHRTRSPRRPRCSSFRVVGARTVGQQTRIRCFLRHPCAFDRRATPQQVPIRRAERLRRSSNEALLGPSQTLACAQIGELLLRRDRQPGLQREREGSHSNRRASGAAVELMPRDDHSDAAGAMRALRLHLSTARGRFCTRDVDVPLLPKPVPAPLGERRFGRQPLCLAHTRAALGRPSISLDERLPSRNTTESLYALLKHTALAVPQALYIGNYTAVLCVDSTLSQQVVHLRRELHCRGQPSPLLQRPGERFNAHRARPGIGARNGDAPDGADGGARYVLTAQGCAEVRALYATDVALWERLCEKEQSRRRL
jgi:hypothetical protein